MKLKGNFHTHTNLCDGEDVPEAMVEEALARGFCSLGFSGHMDPGVFMDYEAYDREIRRLKDKYRGKIDIFRGVELDTVSGHCGSVAVDRIEYSIGSTHYLPAPGSEVWERVVPMRRYRDDGGVLSPVDLSIGHLQEACRRHFAGDYYAMSRAYYAFVAKVADRVSPSFIGHFDLIVKFNALPREEGGHYIDEDSKAYLEPAMACMDLLVREGLPLEVNCGAMNRGIRKEAYPAKNLLSYWQQLGGEVLISSDAHRRDKLDGGFAEALQEVRDCGFSYVLSLTRQATGNRIARNTRTEEGGSLYWEKVFF